MRRAFLNSKLSAAESSTGHGPQRRRIRAGRSSLNIFRATHPSRCRCATDEKTSFTACIIQQGLRLGDFFFSLSSYFVLCDACAATRYSLPTNYKVGSSGSASETTLWPDTVRSIQISAARGGSIEHFPRPKTQKSENSKTKQVNHSTFHNTQPDQPNLT